MNPRLLAETEQQMEQRISAYAEEEWARCEREEWRGTHIEYDQGERLIKALTRIAEALEKQ